MKIDKRNKNFGWWFYIDFTLRKEPQRKRGKERQKREGKNKKGKREKE